MFNSFVLLSPDTVALPIIPSNSIEICHFAKEFAAPPPPSPSAGAGNTTAQPDVPLLDTTCILELPPLQHGALVLRMTCRCEPNPHGPTMSAMNVDTLSPFYSDPAEAIMILHLHMRLTTGAARVYTMVAHRSSLLKVTHDALEAHARAKANGEDLTPHARVSLPPPSPLPAFLPFVANFQPNAPPWPQAPNFHPVLVAPLPHGEGDTDEDAVQMPEEPPSVPWAEWGPAHTRWFQDEFAGTRWITTTCGQRFVRVRGDGRLYVYDFNRIAMRRFVVERALAGDPVGSRPWEAVVPLGAREVWGQNGTVEDLGAHGVVGDVEGELDGDDEDDDDDEWFAALEEEIDAGGGGIELLAPIELPEADDVMEVVGVLGVDPPLEDGPEEDAIAEDAEAASGVSGSATREEANGEQAGPSGLHDRNDAKLSVKVMLGKTVIGHSSAWEGEVESALPYIERSVAVLEEYESALVDEDIIVGLKMDANRKHIREVVLHRIGGPAL